MKILVCDTSEFGAELEKKRKKISIYQACVFVLAESECTFCSELARRRWDLILMNAEFCEARGIDLIQEYTDEIGGAGVIFTAENWKHATEAYRVPHLCFIRKMEMDQYLPDYLVEIQKKKLKTDGKILLTKRKVTNLVDWKNIIFIERKYRKSLLFTTNGEFECAYKLDELQTILGDGFVRCHNSYIVNVYHVTEFRPKMLTLENGAEIPVSRSHKEAVKSWIPLLNRWYMQTDPEQSL